MKVNKQNSNEMMMNKEILLKSGIVHDIRNLLMVIREVIEQIKSPQNDNELVEIMSEEIIQKLNYIGSICDYCIYLTKVKDLFQKVDPNDSNNNGFDITQTIKFCQNIFNERALYDINKDNLKVIFEEKDDKYPTIPLNRIIKSISEIQFKTVLFNFLSNAYKYTDTGAIKIKTRIFNRKDKRQKLRIMVEDSGSGFKGIKIEMNKPYHYHDKGKKNKEGSGFGLYMVTEILRAVNSEIKFKTSDKGSMFYFDLIESCPYNEVIDLSKMYSSYLRQLIDDINTGKKDNTFLISGNLENKSFEDNSKNKTKSPQIHKNKYLMYPYPYNNSIIKLLGVNKQMSIIKDKKIKKQISMNKSFKKQMKSIVKIDKRKLKVMNSYNKFNSGNETLRDNQNIDAIDGIQDIMEEDNRPLYTVIICDDEGMICESIKRLLKNIFENNEKLNAYKLDILTASDGIKCLNLVCDYVSKNKIIKFILMDNSMPYLDGITTCNLIKNSPVLNQTIYLLSGDDNCEDCKADGFLVKPLDEEDLKKIVNKFK